MKLDPFICPHCGCLTKGTLDAIPGVAYLNVDPATGEAEYFGETDVWWDDQRPQQTPDGRVMLICYAGHVWPARQVGHGLGPRCDSCLWPSRRTNAAPE